MTCGWETSGKVIRGIDRQSLGVINIVLMFFGIFYFLICFFTALYLSNNKKQIPLLAWSLLACGLVYGLFGGYFLNGGYLLAEYPGIAYLKNNRQIFFFHSVFSTAIFFGMYIGWNFKNTVFDMIVFKSRKIFNVSNKTIFSLAWFFLIFGFFLRWLYSKEYGGFIKYLAYSRAIRSGIFEINNPFSFLQPFGSLVLISSYFFWSLFHSGYKKNKSFFGLLLSFLFSLYILFSLQGRMGFLIYLSTFVLSLVYIKKIKTIYLVLGIIPAGFLLILFAYILSNLLGIKGADSFVYYIVKELSFPFVSFFAQLEHNQYLFGCFLDIITAPIHLLPSSITSGWFLSANQLNTLVISGAIKGEMGVTGTIPVDLITFGLMQLHFIGIFFIGILFGIVIKLLQNIAMSISNKNVSLVYLSNFSINIAFMSVFYAGSSNFIGKLFPFILIWLVFYALSIIKRLKIK